MSTMSDLARAFYAPGQIGKDFCAKQEQDSLFTRGVRFCILILFPAFGFAWILLYALTGATSFTLTMQYAAYIDLGFVKLQPLYLVPILASIIIALFWFIPVFLFFSFNMIIKANREAMVKDSFKNFLGAMIAPFGVHFAFICIAMWLMTSHATFFWGMRTVEDTIFTITLIISLGLSLASMFFVSKNFFPRGATGSTIAFIVIASTLAGLFYLLL